MLKEKKPGSFQPLLTYFSNSSPQIPPQSLVPGSHRPRFGFEVSVSSQTQSSARAHKHFSRALNAHFVITTAGRHMSFYHCEGR